MHFYFFSESSQYTILYMKKKSDILANTPNDKLRKLSRFF